MNKFWDDKEAVSEYDLLQDEASEVESLAESYANSPELVEVEEEQLEEVAEESAFDLDNTESSIVYNARIRLEQAKLYELLINHNLFEGVEADSRAIELVQNELKHYIVKRLEILMGLRQPVSVSAKSIGPSFNEVEIDFLKQLAYKGTKGRSLINEEDELSIDRKPNRSVPKLNPIKPQTVKNRIKSPRVNSKPSSEKPLKNTPVVPKKNRKRNETNGTKLTAKRRIKSNTPDVKQLTQAQAEQLAREDIENMSKRKPWGQISTKEKIEEIKKVNQRHSKRRPKGALPIPTPEQLEAKYTMDMARRSVGGYSKHNFNAKLADILAAQIKNGESIYGGKNE